MSTSSGCLRGEVAIVTGGSRGIGLETVKKFASEGARVVFCGRDESVGLQATENIGHRGQVSFVACDVSNENDVSGLVDHCAQLFGMPSIIVNNAGVNANFDATEMTESEWDNFFGTDLKASWLTCKYGLRGMIKAGRGSIINVSSIHGLVSLEGFFPYGAAKAGLLGLTRNLALDYGPIGIRVNAVCTGFTRTRLVQESIDRNNDKDDAESKMVAGVALRRIAEPIEIANVIAFLASEEASYVTGATILVDGGLTARRSG